MVKMNRERSRTFIACPSCWNRSIPNVKSHNTGKQKRAEA
jgi:hypothetical protein